MPLYRPSELRSFLHQLGISPKRQLSQNFLIDGNVLKKIAALAELKPGDFVLEIGPGPGVLTEHLLENGCTVVAVEKDDLFAEKLIRLQTVPETLQVVHGDILEFPMEEHLKKWLPDGVKAKVVANIPYHLTAPIIEKIVHAPSVISTATLMVQDEVARRMVATAKTEDFSSFSLFLQYHSDVQYGFLVPPNCFYPPPRVNSAVVRFDLKKRFQVAQEAEFLALIRLVFNQRRKMIRSTLKKLYNEELIEKALHAVGESPLARPEELSIEKWVQFFHDISR